MSNELDPRDSSGGEQSSGPPEMFGFHPGIVVAMGGMVLFVTSSCLYLTANSPENNETKIAGVLGGIAFFALGLWLESVHRGNLSE